MSEIEAAAPVAESAPTSTADVAANVIDAFENTTSDTPESIGDVAEPTPERLTVSDSLPVTKVEDPTAELSEEERLLQEFGFKQAKKPDGRDHYIPRPKVLQMIASGLKRGQERWTSEKTTIESRVQEMEGHLQQLRAGIAGDEVAFLSEVAKIDPRYQRFLQQQTTKDTLPAADDPMPQPDYPLPDGSRTYSLEGLQKRDEWVERQLLRKLDARVDEKLKPLTEREKQAQERDFEQAKHARAKSQMDEAQKWPMFGQIAADGTLSPFQQEVLTEFRKDRSATLRQAYLEVFNRHQAPEKIRERLMADVKRATPRSPALTPGITDAPKEQGPVSTQDIAARTLARLERGA